MRTFMFSIWQWSCLFYMRRAKICDTNTSFPPLLLLPCLSILHHPPCFPPPSLLPSPPHFFQSPHLISPSQFPLSCLSVSPLPHPFSLCLFNKEGLVEESASTPSSLHWATVSLRQETCWHTQALIHTITSYCGTSLVAHCLLFFLFFAVYIILTFSPWILLLFLLLTFSFLCEHVIGFVFLALSGFICADKPFQLLPTKQLSSDLLMFSFILHSQFSFVSCSLFHL